MNISDRFFAGMRRHIAFSFSCGGTLSFQLPRPDQARFPESDQICPTGQTQCFLHQFIIFRSAVLDQRTLQCLAMRIFLPHKPAASSAGQARCNTCTSIPSPVSGKNPAPAPAYNGDRAGSTQAPRPPSSYEPGWEDIRYGTRILILPARFIHLLIAFGKFLIDFMLRFSHHLQAPHPTTCSGATFSCPLT